MCNSRESFSRKTNNRSSIPTHPKIFPGSLAVSSSAPEEMLHVLHKVQVVIVIFILMYFFQSEESQNAFDLEAKIVESYYL